MGFKGHRLIIKARRGMKKRSVMDQNLQTMADCCVFLRIREYFRLKNYRKNVVCQTINTR